MEYAPTIAAETPLLPVLAVTLSGLAVARFAWIVLAMSNRDCPQQADSWEFDLARRIRLRVGSLIYRLCEPLVDELASLPALQRYPLARVRRNLLAGAGDLPWTAEEFTAVKTIEGLLVAGVLAYALSSFYGTATCILAAVLFVAVYPLWAMLKLNKQAVDRLDAIRRRLPYAVDLMALMMEAGAGFRESLATVVAEDRDHPLGQELAKIHHAVDRGQTLRQALVDFRDRLHQDDIGELVFSILKSQDSALP